MCLNDPPDLVTLRSTVTSALLELTLDNNIPIAVSVVDDGTASIISPALVPKTP
jgi:hypothetical protein